MLGTLFQSRGPVGGLALGFWMLGNILPSFVPKWLTIGMLWSLAQTASDIALWKPVGLLLWIPAAPSPPNRADATGWSVALRAGRILIAPIAWRA